MGAPSRACEALKLRTPPDKEFDGLMNHVVPFLQRRLAGASAPYRRPWRNRGVIGWRRVERSGDKVFWERVAGPGPRDKSFEHHGTLPHEAGDGILSSPGTAIGPPPRSGIEAVTGFDHEAAKRPLASLSANGRPTLAAIGTSKLPPTISPGPKAAA
jgi:hypothetical protein